MVKIFDFFFLEILKNYTQQKNACDVAIRMI